jgi:cytochrome c553
LIRAALLLALLALLAAPALANERGAAIAAQRDCAGCHGAGGISRMPEVPSLAAQPAEFLVLQMILFREGLRDVPAMAEAASRLSDADIEAVAAYFAALPPVRPADAGPRDAARAARGAALSATRNCGSCHRPDYSGAGGAPRLSFQREDYLLHAMREYRDDRRVGADTQMNGLLRGLSDAELADLAHHLAQFASP